MKQISYLYLISQLFMFKTIEDEHGNEYVLFEANKLNHIEGIADRTAFEACENHVHLLNHIKAGTLDVCSSIAKSIGQAVLNNLHAAFPQKKFIVFVSMRKNDSLVLRFHQKWINEKPYYNPDDFQSNEEIVFKFE